MAARHPNPLSAEERRQRHNAGQQARYEAKKKGKPTRCSFCGKEDDDLQGHHPDYDVPKYVVWVCRQCHIDIHVRLRASAS
jgi:hypothetical protein